ncbi:uncharacterized protein LOC117306783 [Asterias rubens]|uniref:uncharacterized protein LOC117306783 n=1 Tax=Asterias rubens TaxID=7604 RepID=UPI00145556D4|nr:uncharacterized protein LOC117306783 [Asterias rubens]XP_033647183.1 uncharacterized protein LOC117306783 [Asterias rubens]XP_033647184.1 uncharacterized protein LOC117306783 [Asterias rubens]
MAEETALGFSSLVGAKVSDGLLSLAIAVGKDTGLFDVMISFHQPKTCQEIADAGKYKERYVKEWLGAMVSGKIVSMDVSAEKYWIPNHHKCVFQTGSKLHKAVVETLGVPMLCTAFYDLIECFKLSGPKGVSLAKYSQFNEYINGRNSIWFNHFLVGSLISSVPGLVKKLEQGICVLDVACGEGAAAITMAKHFPNSQFIAFDFDDSAIRTAQGRASQENLTNVQMVCCDGAALPADWTGKFQYIFSRSGIHDQPRASLGLKELHRVLAKDGAVSMLEPKCHSNIADNINTDGASALYAFSLMNCLPLSLNCEGSEGLGAAFGIEVATSMVQDSGFVVKSVTDVEGDGMMHIYCQKKEAEPTGTEEDKFNKTQDVSLDDQDEEAKELASLIEAKSCGAYVCLAIALGMDTGLFDVMIALAQPKTCQEIADAGNLKERYVREWLGAMASSGIVIMDTSEEKFWVSEHHVPVLQRGGKLSRLAMQTLCIPMLSEGYRSVVDCFKLDGQQGVSPGTYSHGNHYINGKNSVWFNHFLVNSFIPKVPGLQKKMEHGICVLDVACGEGAAAIMMAKHFPNSQFIAFDFADSAICTGQETISKSNLTNVQMVCCDGAALPTDWTGKFQYIFSRSGIHDQPRASLGLKELNRVLSDDGLMSVLEPNCHSSISENINLPGAPSLYSFSLMNCLPVSLSYDGSEGLGASWGQEKATSMLQQSGFTIKTVSDVEGDKNIHFLCQKSLSN